MDLMMKIEIDPQQIAEEVSDDEILEFIEAINDKVDSERFTVDLIESLLISLGLDDDQISEIMDKIEE